MDERRFDVIAKALAGGSSRRQVLRRLVGSGAGSFLTIFGAASVGAQGNQDKGNDDKDRDQGNDGNRAQGGDCRGDGHPCEGNQDCCRGLACEPSGPGAANRCTTPEAVTRCEGDCPEQQATVEEVTAEDDAAAGGAICRQDGETCGGDQLCCDGLLCVPTGKDQATRCVSDQPVETCEETCPAEEVKVTKVRAYRVEADCRYNEADDRTTCDCAAKTDDANAPRVTRVTLPQADVCAEVVDGDFEVLAPSAGPRRAEAGTGGQANAEASGGQVVVGDVAGENQIAVDASGGQAIANAAGGSGNVAIAGGGRAVRYASPGDRDVLRLAFAGKVAASGTATYWCETDAGLVPAAGPALVRAQEELAGDAGAIQVRTVACDVEEAPADFDWYGQCRRPAKAKLRLRAVEGGRGVDKGSGATDEGGRRTFRGLPPGTYRVAPEGGDWCHAECDSADDNGDVVLQAGQRATVWLFACAKGR